MSDYDPFELTREQLQYRRFRDGRKQHRPNGGRFVGDIPRMIVEEASDGLNYVAEGMNQGYDQFILLKIRDGFALADEGARELHDLQKREMLAGRFEKLEQS